MIAPKLLLSVLLVVLLSSVVSLVGAEALYRLYQNTKGSTPIGTESHSNDLVDLYVRDSRLGWKNRPLAKGQFTTRACTGTVEFDRDGFRVGVNPPDLPADTPTILFVGDSNLAGFEVDGDETAATHARRAFLNEGMVVRVVNAGVRGYNTLQMQREMERLIEHFHPIHIVVFSAGNDLWENVWPQMPFVDADGYVFAPAFKLENSDEPAIQESPTFQQLLSYSGLPERPLLLRAMEVPVPFLEHLHLIERSMEVISFPTRRIFQHQLFSSVTEAANNPQFELKPPVADLFKIWEHALIQLVSVVSRHDIDLTLMINMATSVPLNNRYDTVLARIAQKLGVRHFPLLAKLLPIYDPSKKHCVSDGHWEQYEHEMVGTLVAHDIVESVRTKISRKMARD